MKWLALAAALLLVAPTVNAGDAAAEALFRAGRDAASSGDWSTACARFEESNRLEPAPGTLFNLANCREKLGQVATAWQLFQELRQKLAPGDRRAKIAAERSAALEKRLPKLTLRLAPGIEEATVLRDGIEVGAASLDIALPVDPGPHQIVIRAKGRAERSISLQINEGENQDVLIEPGKRLAENAPEPDVTTPAPRSTAPPERDTPPSGGSSSRTIGYVIGGIGVAGIGASLITGAMVLHEKSVVQRECGQEKLCSDRGLDAGADGRTLSTVSTIAFAAGAIGLGIGAYLIFSADDGSESAHIEVRAAPSSATLNVGGRF